MAISSLTKGAHSWDSTGRTSRNQPAAPARANTAPKILTEAAVTNPANTSVNPNASTIGHAVAAGTSIFSGMFIAPPLNSDHVNHHEHNHPDRIHEVPIQRKNLQPLGVLAPESRCEIEQRDGTQGKKSH